MLRVSGFLVLVVFAGVLLGSAQSVSAVNIDNCSVLDTAGETYNLTQDILNSPNSTCINIQADNVTLDCNGHRIDGVDSESSYGVYINNYDNITVKNCEIRDWEDGIYIDSSSGDRIANVTVSSNQEMGIYMTSSSNNVIEKSTIKSNTNRGIYLLGSSNNNLSEVNVSYGFSYGVSLDSSSNGNVLNNSILSHNDVNGLGIQSSSGNKIIKTTIFSNDIHGVLMHYSSNNNLTNCEIYSNIGQGVRITYSSKNWIKNTLINDSGGYEVYADHDSTSNNYLLNTTFDKNDVDVDRQAIIWIKWYLDVRVLNQFDSPVEDASVNITDVHGTMWFSNKTNSSGYIQRQILTEYNQTSSGKFYYTKYTVKVNKSLYLSNETDINLTKSEFMVIYLEEIMPSLKVRTYTLGLVEKSIFSPSRLVRIRAFATHYLGKDYLENATLLMRDSSGSIVVNNVLMTNISVITGGYLYEYNYSLPENAEKIWSIRVTVTDSYDNKTYDSTNIAVVPLSLQIRLVLNNTGAKIYVPVSGVGEKTFSGLTPSVYNSPEHFYLASYLNNVLSSLVFSFQNPISIFTEKTSTTYTLGTDQRFSNSMVFIAFTQGNWRAIDRRMSMVEKGEFLSEISPSFAFGLGKSYPFKVVLEYGEIDINSSGVIGRGYNRVVIENAGKSGGKVNLKVKRA